MTPEERERMIVLCQSMQDEKDVKKFSELLSELNKLLENKQNRLTERRKAG